MTKMSSFKRLYLFGFTIVLSVLGLLTYMGYQISRKIDWNHSKTKEQIGNIIIETDTIVKEVLVEKVIRDTIYKLYAPPKPKLELKDTSTNHPLPSVIQSQD